MKKEYDIIVCGGGVAGVVDVETEGLATLGGSREAGGAGEVESAGGDLDGGGGGGVLAASVGAVAEAVGGDVQDYV